MTVNEFKEEVMNSELCPTDFARVYREFQDYQYLAISTLRKFHAVCEKNGIEYQLAFGSLLGCIRDNGQIPWDYDVDVIVPFDKRDELIAALSKDLDDSYYFYSVDTNKKCNHVIIRLAPKGFDTAVLHVDVFFLTGLPNHKQLYYKKLVKMYTLLIKAKRYDFNSTKYDRKTEVLKMVCYLILGVFMSEKRIWNKYKKISGMYPLEGSQKCCLADRFSGSYNLDTKDFMNTTIMHCDIGEVRIPVNYEAVLRKIYGDYKVTPSLESRIKELYKHYIWLKKYAKIEYDKM